MVAGALKDSPLLADYECTLVVSTRLDLPNLSNKVNNCAPA